MKRPVAVLVVLLKPGTTLADVGELAELLKHHRIVARARLELPGPSVIKARTAVERARLVSGRGR